MHTKGQKTCIKMHGGGVLLASLLLITTIFIGCPGLTTPPAAESFAVNFSVDGGNGMLSASVDGRSIASGNKVDKGKTVVFTAAPAADYSVEGWTGATPDAGNPSTARLVVSAAATVRVRFVVPTMVLTTKINVGGLLELGIDAADADKPGVWIDLNNNGSKDPGEAVTRFNSTETYTLGAKTVSIYGKVTGLGCARNMLTALSVDQNPALTILYCGQNELTQLDLRANRSLTIIDVSVNMITTAAMTELVAGLPDTQSDIAQCTLQATDDPAEQNILPSNTAILIAKAKGWSLRTYPGNVELEVPFYAGGYSTNNAEKKMPGYWIHDGKTTTWTSLPLVDGESTEVTSLAVVGSDVYAGGYSKGSLPLGSNGYWDKDGVWQDLGKSYRFHSVQAIAVVGSDVYAGGGTTESTLERVYPCYWKNSTRIDLPPAVEGASAGVSSLVVLDSTVYAGGSSYNSQDVSVPGYWTSNGATSAWHALPPAAADENAAVTSLAVVGDTVYVGGSSENSEYVSVPGYWTSNGATSAWHALPPAAADENAAVTSLAVVGGTVYAGGWRGMVPGYWTSNGATSAWHALPLAATDKYAAVTSLAVVGGVVYAGGYSKKNSGVWVPCYWTSNGTRNAGYTLPPAVVGKDAEVKSIVIKP